MSIRVNLGKRPCKTAKSRSILENVLILNLWLRVRLSILRGLLRRVEGTDAAGRDAPPDTQVEVQRTLSAGLRENPGRSGPFRAGIGMSAEDQPRPLAQDDLQ